MAVERIAVYLETGTKRTVAGALEWPGWCRVGKDEETALAGLVSYAPRYGKVLSLPADVLPAVSEAGQLEIVERLSGDATTDFGVPGKAPRADGRPLDEGALRRLQAILADSWKALAEAVRQADGQELRKGPRGGGRELDKIVRHVIDSNAGYLRMIGQKTPVDESLDLQQQLEAARVADAEAVDRAVREGVPPGSRGGARWTPRYYARRAAWHILDHAWEIEDRIVQ